MKHLFVFRSSVFSVLSVFDVGAKAGTFKAKAGTFEAKAGTLEAKAAIVIKKQSIR
ncbi:MAG: hypothetical protein LBV57_03640 [Candidatus Symbiothrix sp.]|jgi:hypothetical protein|nr:hypothetical protein [Candidatus Symbiothrix sp.]